MDDYEKERDFFRECYLYISRYLWYLEHDKSFADSKKEKEWWIQDTMKLMDKITIIIQVKENEEWLEKLSLIMKE